jgi:hypothetical protein
METVKTYIAQLWEWLRDHNGVWWAFFVILYVGAWGSNALLGTKFVMKELQDLGVFVVGQYSANSLLNTPIPGIVKEVKE